MEKNVVVIDEQGNKIGATFPKRAKGLVKNGRARFIDENTICLACPPNEFLEDNKMNNNINEIVENNIPEENTVDNSAKPLTLREIFEQINKLQEDVTNPNTSFDNLARTIPYIFDEEHPENEERSKCVEMLADSYNIREETTWKILKFYEKMYEDVAKLEKIKASTQLIQNTYVGMLAVTNNSKLDAEAKFTQNQSILDKMSSMIEKLIS